jgi:hypothetical protein
MIWNHAHLFLLRAQWELRRMSMRIVRAHGMVAVIAAAIGMAALLALAWMSLLQDRSETMRMSLIEQRRERAARPSPIRHDPVQTIESLRASLPASSRIPQVVQHLFVLAGREKLVLKTGEYKIVTESATSTQMCRIRLPITGNAAAIQRFTLNAINEHRSLALESLSMRRERVDASEVEANVQFVLVTSAAGDDASSTGGAT